ncbi:MAG: (Fe-S)-binding protein [Acidimicrobiia bacterium]
MTTPTATTEPGRGGVLGLDDDALKACVNCGLCLPHCPTFRVTGEESASPRGRINAMRAVESGGEQAGPTFVGFMEACVQCRACEAVCPSSVPFGHLMEATRAALRHAPATRPGAARRLVERVGLGVIAHRAVLRVLTTVIRLVQRLPLVGRSVPLPPPGPPRGARAARRGSAPEGGPDLWLFDGCVMDAWFGATQEASRRLLEDTGATVSRPGRGSDCCGALHLHAGRRFWAQRLARRVMRSMPGDAPVVVDSAGCGAALKDYGHLLGTPEAERFSARVRDISEILRPDDVACRPTGRAVVLQEPCHLRHVQGLTGAWRDVLAGAYTVVDTDDDGLCCGAGGLYNVVQPDLSGQILRRKVATIRAAVGDAAHGEPVVASANPGCILQLRRGGLRVAHPSVLVVDALDPDRGGARRDRSQ